MPKPKDTVTVRFDKGRFEIYTPYSFYQTCKSLTGVRADYEIRKNEPKRDKIFRCWYVPATPAAAAEVTDAFMGYLDAGATPPEFQTMLSEVEASREVLSLDKEESDFAPIPHTLRKPWLHQLRGYHAMLVRRAAYHAWDMGTGKSKTIVDYVANSGDSPVLIVCPKSVVPVWPMEFRKHSAKRIHVEALQKGSVAKRLKCLQQAIGLSAMRDEQFVAVINYEAAWHEPMGTFLHNVPWALVAADEIHKIKDPRGTASKFMARFAITTPKRAGLSGTPLPHSPLDAFGQYRFLDPGIFGTSFIAFRSKYARMGGYGNHQVLGFQNMDEFNKRFYSIATRVSKDDVLDLPPTVDVERFVELEPRTAAIYKKLESELAVQIAEGTVTAGNALVKLLRLQQITGGHIQLDDHETVSKIDTAKYEALVEYLDDLSAYEPVVVFCRFTPDLAVVRKAAAKLNRSYCELSGRENALTEWQGGAGTILGVQIQAGGLGIDLTRSAQCAYYSLGFSLGDYLQSKARLDRMGQTRSVTYTHFIATGTVDQVVYRALSERHKIIEAVLARLQENSDVDN